MENKTPPEKAQQPLEDEKPASPTSSLNKILLIVAVVIILILGGIIFFLLQRSGQTVTKNSPTPTITETIKPTAIISDTSAWKTYTNHEAGFTLKYPASVLFETELKGTT